MAGQISEAGQQREIVVPGMAAMAATNSLF
jgi:hypothetical protein